MIAQKWNKDLKVSLTQGRISSTNGAGSLNVYVQKGDVTIQDHNGKVEADSYMGTMNLRNIQGDVGASLFAGQLQIEKVRGIFNSVFTTIHGESKSKQRQQIQFENGKGALNIQTFQGRMEGQNQEGTVTIGVSFRL